MSTIQPGINSIVTLTVGTTEHTFTATVSIDSTEENERVDVTGFGDTSRAYVMGIKAATEITIRTYADPHSLGVGDALAATSISFGGTNGRVITGAATVVSYSSSADVDGATVYEIGLLY